MTCERRSLIASTRRHRTMLQDLLTNLLSVIDSGGDVTTYLNGKTDQYLQRVMQDQKSFLEMLGLIAESYVTAFVAGPLFIIIMASVMTIMNGGSPMILYVIVYGMLPLGSVMFIVLISILTPSDDAAASKFDDTCHQLLRYGAGGEIRLIGNRGKEAHRKDPGE